MLQKNFNLLDFLSVIEDRYFQYRVSTEYRSLTLKLTSEINIQLLKG